MTQNAPSLLERSSRLWRLDELPADKTSEGPVALLRSLCMLALRHKTKLILCTAVGVGLAAAYAHSLPRTYTATATVLLEPRQVRGQPGITQAVNHQVHAQGENHDAEHPLISVSP